MAITINIPDNIKAFVTNLSTNYRLIQFYSDNINGGRWYYNTDDGINQVNFQTESNNITIRIANLSDELIDAGISISDFTLNGDSAETGTKVSSGDTITVICHYNPGGGEEPEPEKPTVTGEIRYYFDDKHDSDFDSTYTADDDNEIYPADYILNIKGYTFSQCTYNGTKVDSTSWLNVSDGKILKIYYITTVITQSIQVCFLGNCKGINILSEDETSLTNGFLYEDENDYNEQYQVVATPVTEGQKLILQHKGYDTGTYTWWELIGWYYGDTNGNRIYIGDARAETFSVPAETEWNKIIYCEAIRHNNGIKFKWDKEKKAGETFNVTAAEWIRLTRFIDAQYNDYTNRFTRSEVATGKNFTAKLFNEVTSALKLNIKINSRDVIYASYFADILRAVNNL